ncbi:MAG: BspA family leucine-rich repeat surface protein [Bacteroidales bacterium]|nr:BspA family leucine-rich repeat surface protein [Bacteroidales bacterium]
MKNTLLNTVFTAAVLFTAAACARDIEMPSDNGAAVNASIEALTRTQFAREGSIYKVNWVAGDRIAVANANTTAYYTADSGGSPASSFTPAGSAISGGPYTAWYPASLSDGILPAIQYYKADGTVETPMSADSGTLDFNFRNLCGIIRLDVSTSLEGVRLDRIVLKADQGLSGAFYRSGLSAVVTASDGVCLDCGGAALGKEPAAFFISVPPRSYTGLEITLFTSDGLSQKASLKEGATYTVERSRVCEIAFEANDFAHNHYDYATLRPGSELNEIIRRLAGNKESSTAADSSVRRIVFDPGSRVSGGVRVDAYNSPHPVYVNWNEAEATATVSTPAGSFRTGPMCAHMFSYFYALEEIVNLNSLDTSDAQDMGSMFTYAGYRSKKLTVDVSGFNTSNVTTMYHMFYFCESVEELDVSGWDTGNVTNFDNTFRSCSKLKALDLSSFNTSKATVFRSMFNRCESIEELDADSFNTGKGELMTYVFYKMTKLRRLSIRNFDVNRPSVNIIYMFSNCPNLSEIYLGEGFLQDTTPSSFFLAQTEGTGVRTASLSKKLTIYCNKATADWLARTNLRWIHSGYNGKTPIEVVFIDNSTGETLSPKWAAN